MVDYRIGLIDGNEQVRSGRAMIINAQSDMKVVLEESDPLIAIERAPDYLVDVLLVGPSQHRLRGDQFIQSLARALIVANNGCAILAYSAFNSPKLRFEAIKAGAQDFIGLDDNAKSLLSLIRLVAKNDFLVDPAQLREFTKEFGPVPRSNQLELKLSELSAKQTEILELFLGGSSDQQIAKRLDIARTRVTQLLDTLLSTTGFTSRNQLALALLGGDR